MYPQSGEIVDEFVQDPLSPFGAIDKDTRPCQATRGHGRVRVTPPRYLTTSVTRVVLGRSIRYDMYPQSAESIFNPQNLSLIPCENTLNP
jgi:hypothetical protein